MEDQLQTSTEDYDRGFRKELKEAVDAALDEDDVLVGDTRIIDYIEVKRIRRNPLHDYRVVFK